MQNDDQAGGEEMTLEELSTLTTHESDATAFAASSHTHSMAGVADKALDKLDLLAAKLGVTVQYLWPLLVRQTKVQWIGTAVASVLGLAIGIPWATFCARKLNTCDCDEEGPLIVFMFIFMGLALASMIAVGISICTIDRFLVPEAATVERILGMVKQQ